MESFEILFTFLLALATLICGVYLQYRYGLLQDRVTRREIQLEGKKDLVQLLIVEINDNNRLLKKKHLTNKYGNKMYLQTLFRDGYEIALQSNVYLVLSSDLSTILKYYYDAVNKWNELVDKYEGEEIATTLQQIFNAQTMLKNQIIENTTNILNLLNNELD